MGLDNYHEAVTGEDRSEQYPRERRREYRKDRREAGREAARAEDWGEKRFARAKGKADEALEQAVTENLQLSVKFLKEYKELKDRYNELDRSGNLRSREGRQVKREYQRKLRQLRQTLRRHVDDALLTKEEATLLKEIGVNKDLKQEIKAKTTEEDIRADQEAALKELQEAVEEGKPKEEPQKPLRKKKGRGKSSTGGGTGIGNPPATDENEKDKAKQPPKTPAETDPNKGGTPPKNPEDADDADTNAGKINDGLSNALKGGAGVIPDGGRTPETPEEKLAREKAEKEKKEIEELSGGVEKALNEYRKEVRDFRPLIEEGKVGAFSFKKVEMAGLDARDGLLATSFAEFTKSIADKKPFNEIKTKGDALKKELIEKATPELTSYKEVYKKTQETETKRETYAQQVDALKAAYPGGEEKFKEQLGPEYEALQKIPAAIESSLKEFNSAETLDKQEAALEQMTKDIEKGETERAVIEETVSLYFNGEKTLPEITQSLAAAGVALDENAAFLQGQISSQAAHPLSGWLAGKGLFGNISAGFDRIRDDIYHARFLGGNPPDTQIANLPEAKVLDEASLKLANAQNKFNDKASTLEMRRDALKEMRTAQDETYQAERTFEQKMDELGQKVEGYATSKKASYLGRGLSAIPFFNLDLDEMSTVEWAEKGMGRKIVAPLLGFARGAEGLVKLGAGVVIGIPMALTVTPLSQAKNVYDVVFGDKTLGEGWNHAREITDNNTLTQTLTNVIWDGVLKTVVLGPSIFLANKIAGDKAPAFSKGMYKWAFENNSFIGGLKYLVGSEGTGSVHDSGYFRAGESIHTVLTALLLGRAVRGARATVPTEPAPTPNLGFSEAGIDAFANQVADGFIRDLPGVPSLSAVAGTSVPYLAPTATLSTIANQKNEEYKTLAHRNAVGEKGRVTMEEWATSVIEKWKGKTPDDLDKHPEGPFYIAGNDIRFSQNFELFNDDISIPQNIFPKKDLNVMTALLNKKWKELKGDEKEEEKIAA
ncbi:MAG: hypothetical protein WCW30_02910 [Candidatus Gracilibacteria bacterium]